MLLYNKYILKGVTYIMHTLIVYTHPSEKSFTFEVKNKIIDAIEKKGWTWEESDLYKQGFNTDMSEDEYIREAFYHKEKPLPLEVQLEQEKILRAKNIIFVYPVFWTEAPAKLVGWFDRVWTVGFAYEDCIMPNFEHVLFFAIAGNTKEHLENKGFAKSMETIMCGDRIGTRAKHCTMHILTETSRGMPNREKMLSTHLTTVSTVIEAL